MISDIREILSEPVFWLVSVVTSLFLTVLGNLITPRVGGVLSRYVSNWRFKKEVSTYVRANEVHRYYDNFEIRIDAKLSAIYQLSWSMIAWFASALGLFVLALAAAVESPSLWLIAAPVALCVIGPVFATRLQFAAIKRMAAVRLADRRADDLHAYRMKHGTANTNQEEFLREWDDRVLYSGIPSEHKETDTETEN